MKRTFLLTAFIMLTVTLTMKGQQVADTTYNPLIEKPAYARNMGPIVFIDEGHFNFHTKNERYLPFARLLERDGYRVQGYKGQFESEKLNEGRILVVSNALNETNTTRSVQTGSPCLHH